MDEGDMEENAIGDEDLLGDHGDYVKAMGGVDALGVIDLYLWITMSAISRQGFLAIALANKVDAQVMPPPVLVANPAAGVW